ncbi:MAG: hypothetical protein DRJ32_05115 [Thermoprotei archaeon]|nr:MAG: hypothetical protein DRJ32_05115 [Thermoprotei archaeon]
MRLKIVRKTSLLILLVLSYVLYYVPLTFTEPQHSICLGRLALIIVVDGAEISIVNGLEEFNLLKNYGIYFSNAYTVLPSATTPAHTALAYGTYPNVSGVVYTYAVDREEYHVTKEDIPKTVSWYDQIMSESIVEVARENGVLTALIVGKEKLKVMMGLNQVADVLKILPSELAYGVYDPNLPIEARYRQDEWIINETISVIRSWSELIHSGEYALVIVNLPALDWTGHACGPESEEYYLVARHAFQQVLSLVDIIKAEGLWNNTLMFVLADHGMSDTKPSKMLLPSKDKHHWGVLTGIRHYLIDTGGTAAFIYLKDKRDLEKAVKLILKSNLADAIYSISPINSVNGTLEDVGLNSPFAGDIFVSLKNGYQFSYPNEGAHGGVSTQKIFMFMLGGVISSKLTYSNEIVSIVDVAPTICEFLGLPIPESFKGKTLNYFFAPKVSLKVSISPSVIELTDSYAESTILVNGSVEVPSKLYIYVDEEEIKSSDISGEFSETVSIKVEEGEHTVLVKILSDGKVIGGATSKIFAVKIRYLPLPWNLIYASIVIGVLISLIPLVLLIINMKRKKL